MRKDFSKQNNDQQYQQNKQIVQNNKDPSHVEQQCRGVQYRAAWYQLIRSIGMMGLVILYSFLGGAFEHYHFHYIHQTGAGILIGVIFGVIVYFLHDFSNFQFNEELFFLALLPPMIFSGGYNLKKKQFFKNIKYILIYGLVGTLVSFFVIFGLTYAINKLEWIVPLRHHQDAIVLTTALMIKYSATISATDSVAALTLIKPSQHPKLFSVIFGEGMVNDAVAIILFKVVGGVFEDGATHMSNLAQGDNEFDGVTVLKILWQFFYTVIISIFIGGAIALFCTWLFKTFRFLSKPIAEVVIVYLFGILSYLISQVLDMSGVLTVLVAGVMMAHFNFYNLSMTGQVATGTTYQSIAFIAQAIVFIYLGLSFMYYVTNYTISLSFFGLELLICIISRLTAIFVLGYAVKAVSKWVLSANEMAIVSTAGTIRGSVAFALILTVQAPEHATQEEQIAVEIIKSTVLFMVFLTTILLGGMMPWFIKVFLGSSGDQHKQSIKISFLEEQKDKQAQRQNKPKGFFKRIDEKFLKPFFIYDYENRKEDIKKWKKFLKMNSPDYKGAELTGIMKANIRQTIIHEMQIQKSMKYGGTQSSLLLGTEYN